MLLLKESSFKDDTRTPSTFDGSSSSPTALVTSISSTPKGSSSKSPTLLQLCNHFNKGTCRFGVQIHTQSSKSCGTFLYPQPKSQHCFKPCRCMKHGWDSTQGFCSPCFIIQALIQLHCWPNCLLRRPSPLLIPATPPGTPAGPTSPVLAAAVRSSSGYSWTTSITGNYFTYNSIPVINTGHCTIPSAHRPIPSAHRPLHLHNVIVTPNIIKNLISVRQFTRDNNCTIEFDAFGFSLKDFWTRHILLRCDISGDLYPVTKLSGDLYPVTKLSPLPTAFVNTSSSTWHQRLGHPEDDVLRTLST
nr:ribonuclease H-like domain-containing protein [Tanacetum cinerariifolium]